jgi:hypothetical protein
VPRILVADHPELWRRLERTPLQREEVHLVLARPSGSGQGEGGYDAVLVPEGPDAAAVARALGLALRRRSRSTRVLSVEAGAWSGRTKDASPEGAFVIGGSGLEAGESVEAALGRPGRRERARVLLTVVRCARAIEEEGGLEGVGVRLEPRRARDRLLLERWLGGAGEEA